MGLYNNLERFALFEKRVTNSSVPISATSLCLERMEKVVKKRKTNFLVSLLFYFIFILFLLSTSFIYFLLLLSALLISRFLSAGDSL